MICCCIRVDFPASPPCFTTLREQRRARASQDVAIDPLSLLGAYVPFPAPSVTWRWFMPRGAPRDSKPGHVGCPCRRLQARIKFVRKQLPWAFEIAPPPGRFTSRMLSTHPRMPVVVHDRRHQQGKAVRTPDGGGDRLHGQKMRHLKISFQGGRGGERAAGGRGIDERRCRDQQDSLVATQVVVSHVCVRLP